MCSKCVQNLLQMCSKCVPNVLQVCALQFGMKVIWCVDQRPTICRIGQFHMIVMRIITNGDLMMMIARQKDERLLLLARLVLGHKLEMAATNLCYMQLQLLMETFDLGTCAETRLLLPGTPFLFLLLFLTFAF